MSRRRQLDSQRRKSANRVHRVPARYSVPTVVNQLRCTTKLKNPNHHLGKRIAANPAHYSNECRGIGLGASPDLGQVGRPASAAKVYQVGVLLNRNNPSPETESLRTGLTQLGYFEGTDVVYEVRAAEGQLDRLPGFAVELVSRGVDVVVSYAGAPANAARKATTTRWRSCSPLSPIRSPSGATRLP